MRSNWLGVVLVGAAVVLALASAPGRAGGSPTPPPRPLLGDPAPAAAATPTLASGFTDTVALSGLNHPTGIRFSPDGRVFVIEKAGLLKVFDGLSDPTPTTVVDLRSEVDDYWDRGLLGLALDPNFPATPYVYLLYTYDAPPGQTAPVWNDACPSPPGPNTDGCVVSGKLVRIQVSPSDQEVPPRKVLISNEWCQQFPSHSIGDLAFGPDGRLYVSGGDGASFTFADYGQNKNPCGDPPGGATLTPPTAAGGALRAQSPNRVAGPAVLNGSLLRLDQSSGNAAADNPNAGSSDANLRRIVAYGFRNPFRFAFRPGTSELWLGDVGWNDWEEINRIQTPPATVQDFGWPCYEGAGPQPGYQSAGLNICTTLYGAGTAVSPYYTYNHAAVVANNDGCPTTQGSVVSAIGFYSGSSYPAAYHGALVFGDHSRECIWTMPLGANGEPDPTQVQVLESNAANPVDIQSGPNGDLFYADFDGNAIHRISYSPSGSCADGMFLAEYHNSIDLSGAPVLTRCESAIDNSWGTSPPAPGVNADNFSVRWTGRFAFAAGRYTFTSTADDGVRVYVDGALRIDDWKDQTVTTEQATVQLAAGTHTVEVDYYDHTGSAVAQVSWQAIPNTPPVPVIDAPSPALTYAVGDPISFSGHASDAEDGALPASKLSWTLLIHHCTTPSTCHVHDVQSWDGVASGSLSAPDHDYPSHLELILTATDSGGATGTASVTLDPKTVDLTFATNPAGLSLAVGSAGGTAPFMRTVIAGSANSVSAPANQQLGGTAYGFSTWSDAGAATHNVTAPASAVTYTATYLPTATAPPPPPPVLPPLSVRAPTLSGTAKIGGLLTADAGGWSGSAPLGFSFAWLRCSGSVTSCEVVAGAGGTRYRVSAGDIGSRIVARVTATNAIGSATVPTNASSVVPRFRRGRIHALRRAPTPPRPRAHR